MEHNYVCPWQAGPILTATLRKLLHNPAKITKPYLSNGNTAMDVGCGMGFLTIPMAEIVGKQGKVIAVDLQSKMLDGLKTNMQKQGIKSITPHLCETDSLRIEQWNGTVDFALIFMMLHEVPDADRLIREVYDALAPNGKLLFAEPIVHVSKEKFNQELNMIQEFGFSMIDTPKISICRTAVFQK